MSFSNFKTDLCNNISILPIDIIEIIYSYIPKFVTIFLTKKDYVEEHYLLKNYINKRDIENYIRAMIRRDNDFVLKHLLVENYTRWISIKKYYYKGAIYENYLFFLKAYCIDNESINCKNVLIKLFEELGLSKNQHKKKTYNYIRWKI